jgi:hypothetical protein
MIRSAVMSAAECPRAIVFFTPEEPSFTGELSPPQTLVCPSQTAPVEKPFAQIFKEQVEQPMELQRRYLQRTSPASDTGAKGRRKSRKRKFTEGKVSENKAPIKGKGRRKKSKTSSSSDSTTQKTFKGIFGVDTGVKYKSSVTVATDKTTRNLVKRRWREYSKKDGDLSESSMEELERYRELFCDSVSKASHTKRLGLRKEGGKIVCYAKEPFSKDETIGECTGVVRRTEKVRDKAFAFEFSTDFDGISIDSGEEANETRFIKAASSIDSANVDPVEVFDEGLPHVVFIAEKAIRAGDPLSCYCGEGYCKAERPIDPMFLKLFGVSARVEFSQTLSVDKLSKKKREKIVKNKGFSFTEEKTSG